MVLGESWVLHNRQCTHRAIVGNPRDPILIAGRVTGDSDLTVAALLALGTISYQKVYERKEFLVAGGDLNPRHLPMPSVAVQ